MTALCLHYGIKIPLNHYVGNLRNMNHIEYMNPCSKLTGFFNDFEDNLLPIDTKKDLKMNTKTTCLFFNLIICNTCCFV